MRLNDALVTFFVYNDVEYEIDLSFDNVLDVYDVLDMDLHDFEKARMCLTLLIGKHDYQNLEAIELWNYIYSNFIHVESKEVVKKDLLGNVLPAPKKEEGEEERLIDFDKDANYIYASFMQAYNINLFEQQGVMHWKEFLALLDGLPSNTRMKEIIRIRSWTPSKHDSNEYKEQMRELQDIYSLESEVE